MNIDLIQKYRNDNNITSLKKSLIEETINLKEVFIQKYRNDNILHLLKGKCLHKKVTNIGMYKSFSAFLYEGFCEQCECMVYSKIYYKLYGGKKVFWNYNRNKTFKD